MVQKKSQSRKKLIILALLLAVLIAVVAWRLWPESSTGTPEATTTSKAKTAQKDYTSGKDRPVSSQNSLSQGGAVDQKGAGVASTSPSSWKSSQSGQITLKSPTGNSSLMSGDTLSGSAAISTVQYRVVDDQNGVIAQGQLSVIGGDFSGKLQFKAYGTKGTVTVFSFDEQSGAEINRVQIPVTLNP